MTEEFGLTTPRAKHLLAIPTYRLHKWQCVLFWFLLSRLLIKVPVWMSRFVVVYFYCICSFCGSYFLLYIPIMYNSISYHIPGVPYSWKSVEELINLVFTSFNFEVCFAVPLIQPYMHARRSKCSNAWVKTWWKFLMHFIHKANLHFCLLVTIILE